MISIDEFAARLKISFSHFRKLDESFLLSQIAPEICSTHLHYAFDDDQQFLEALLPTSETFLSNFQGRRKKFLARGHKHADTKKYKLIPTIFRRPEKGTHQEKMFEVFINGYISGANIDYETSVFASFLSGLNYNSAFLSNDSINFLQSIENFAATETSHILGPNINQLYVFNFPKSTYSQRAFYCSAPRRTNSSS